MKAEEGKKLLGLLVDIATSTGRRAVPASEDVVVENVLASLPEMLLRSKGGGFSLNPRTGKFLNPGDTGYMMATVKELPNEANRIKPEDLINLIRDPYYMDRLRRGQYLGGWLDNQGRLVLDPSQRFVNKNRSIIRGGRAAQEGGFDLRGNTAMFDATNEPIISPVTGMPFLEGEFYGLSPEVIAAAKREAIRRGLAGGGVVGAGALGGILGMKEE